MDSDNNPRFEQRSQPAPANTSEIDAALNTPRPPSDEERSADTAAVGTTTSAGAAQPPENDPTESTGYGDSATAERDPRH